MLREITFLDLANGKSMSDDDDEDDSDWEPGKGLGDMVKWFCTNCTMPNFGDVHCSICGEHKESGILMHGFFSSPFSPNSGFIKNADVCHSASNSASAIGFDKRMLLHSEVEMKSHPHVERPDRLRAIVASLVAAGIFPQRCHLISAREITQKELEMVHSLEHIQAVGFTSQMFCSYFTPDTYTNEHSALAARLAAGLCADLSSAIVAGRVKNGFALVRPPGHHAGVSQAMGFCLHNNAAVAALAAQAAGAKKVLIVDWDVHHGNGTQEIFEKNKLVLYISLHRHDKGRFYPFTGAADEVGNDGAEGYCVNVPWSCRGVGDDDYIFAFQHVVLPIASGFAPDFVIISAGFDAARGDPLGCCDVTPAGYARMATMLNRLAGGKLLVILEGGYNLRSISSSATAVIKVLLGEEAELESGKKVTPSASAMKTVLEVLRIHAAFWPFLGLSYSKLQAQWRSFCSRKSKIQARKMAVKRKLWWWKWGRRRLLYNFLTRGSHLQEQTFSC